MDKREEELRGNIYKAWDKHGRGSKELIEASEDLDKYMNEHYYRKMIKNERRQ
ncbi:hypothetical protein CLPUN_08010 [Clostridium puniceum]|uniref:Spo0E like sporulation regulatory protein n=1 Tax=Clostridium puniceum TaxID=29367 RepID=A0A1S8TW47_9CLOT|nr:aspartyl-phosphate phosphatase Spo0E family protein [Clostridium puniceum]OOM81839.1 hypothetical protein CLPUN_08010 [Clostridium puniceum]